MSSFTPASDSVVLENGSCILIQGISSAATTPTLSLSSIFYLPYFSLNLLSTSKIVKVLNCTGIFFRRIVYFMSLGRER